MTDWELETLEDFNGTFFDDGIGWKTLFQIHMGISVRAQLTRHPIRIGDFDTQISGIVWTGDFGVDGFKDLPTRLRDCYSAIESLLSSDENIRWTESSGRSPEWTIESMIDDIGMGEFADLMLRPQSPEPFVWLIAALNRLNHPKLKRSFQLQNLSLDPGPPASLYRVWGPEEIVTSTTSTGPWATIDDAWDGMAYSSNFNAERNVTLGAALLWGAGANLGGGSLLSIAVTKTILISLMAKRDTGDMVAPIDNWFRFLKPRIICIDYVYDIFATNYTGPDWIVKIGSSEDTNVGSANTSGLPVIESVSDDLDFEGTKTIEVELLTSRPSSAPFALYLGEPSGRIDLGLRWMWLYCDLPETMGVGELTAPIPTVSGEAEQEE